jgi:hypothetical protein
VARSEQLSSFQPVPNKIGPLPQSGRKENLDAIRLVSVIFIMTGVELTFSE